MKATQFNRRNEVQEINYKLSARSWLERDQSEPAHILLLIMLFRKADDAFTLLQHYIMPLTNPAISLDLANREIVLIAETNLVDPVLACLQAYFSDGTCLVKNNSLVALVDAGVAGEGRHHAVAEMELHRKNAAYLVV